MTGDQIALALTVICGAFSAGSDTPWWMRSLAAVYIVGSAYLAGRHIGSSRIGKD